MMLLSSFFFICYEPVQGVFEVTTMLFALSYDTHTAFSLDSLLSLTNQLTLLRRNCIMRNW